MRNQEKRSQPTPPSPPISTRPSQSVQNFEFVPQPLLMGLEQAFRERNVEIWDNLLVPDLKPLKGTVSGRKDLRTMESIVFGDIESSCTGESLVQVKQSWSLPWCRICKLVIRFGDDPGDVAQGTGFFISPRLVLTAGHNVHYGAWMKKISVLPAWDGTRSRFGYSASVWFHSVEGWTINRDPHFDYAVIVLPDFTLGKKIGHFQIGMPNESDTGTGAGYPVLKDAPLGQWYASGKLIGEDQLIRYSFNTYRGQSGGPIWQGALDNPTVVGIHTNGGCPNFGIRFNADVLKNIHDWIRLYELA